MRPDYAKFDLGGRDSVPLHHDVEGLDLLLYVEDFVGCVGEVPLQLGDGRLVLCLHGSKRIRNDEEEEEDRRVRGYLVPGGDANEGCLQPLQPGFLVGQVVGGGL